jgi:hypothetical protein
MTTPGSATDQAPPPTPGERRLAHPPSDRYRADEERRAAAAEASDASASLARGLAIAITVAAVGSVAIVLLGGVLAVTSGLVVVAGATAWGVAAGLRFGAGSRLAGRRRVAVAIAIAVGAVLLGQLGLWQYARVEGGVLPLLDYLMQVFGLLVPLQFAVATVVAWVAAR